MSTISFLFFLSLWIYPHTVDHAEMKPYLAQDPPGHTAEIFAPGIVNVGKWTRDVAISPDGKEFYFGMGDTDYTTSTIMISREVGGNWTEPSVAGFASNRTWRYLEPAYSPDGNSFFFVSNQPASTETGNTVFRIWKMEKLNGSWSEPKLLPDHINNGTSQYFPSATDTGTLYFTRRLESGREVIVRSPLDDGEYQEVEILPEQVNSGSGHYNAFVSPDESYIIVPTEGRSDSIGGTDYYISVRSSDDIWSGPYNLGPSINSRFNDQWSPYVSPDGKYLFFMRGHNDPVTTLKNLVDESIAHRIVDLGLNRQALIWWIDFSVVRDAIPE